MAILQDYQSELGGVAFGYGLPVAVDGEGFDPGTDDPETQDSFTGFTESYDFGVDSLQPASWAWGMHTDLAQFSDDAIRDSAALEIAWKTACDRRDPGAVAALRYAIGGRTRVVYGRPRRYSSTKTNSMIYGVINITSEFQRADTLFYGDDLSSITLNMQPQQSLGLMSPIVSPITTLVGAPPLSTTSVIGGDVPAPFTATINGPSSGSITNPKISNGQWELQLLTSIASGQSVTISTYPWAMNAIRSDGAYLSSFTAKSRLSKARLAVAGETLRLDGIDSSGTATATVQWRRAYSTI
ncbi:MAG: hypothetical protein H7201_02765 [Candidatus Saccharibacteria bacterium]|nr:hypothetical protein [Microbacteriaceae bacterium]